MFKKRLKIHQIIAVALAVVMLFGVVGNTILADASSGIKNTKTDIELEDMNYANAFEIESNRYTHYYEKTPVVSSFTTDGYEIIHENETLAIYLNKTENRLRIMDKRTGYLWGDLPNEKIEGLNKTWTKYATSIIAIEYYDKKNNEKKVGMNDTDAKTSYKKISDGIEVTVSFQELDIELKTTLLFTDTGFQFCLNREDIKEGEDFLLKSVSFLPFLGCSRGDAIDGYFMIPDGQGALMYFESPLSYTSAFDKKVYGADYAYDKITQASDLLTSRPNDYSVDEAVVYLPVYGIVHGIDQNAILVSIDDGEEYASVLASPAGYLTDYNWATMRFNYRQKYNQPTSKEGGGVFLPNKEKNAFDIKISYDFLTGEHANYSGMAVFYRNKLEEAGLLYQREQNAESDIPLRVELLGADVQKKLFFERLQVFTTATEAAEIIEDIHNMGISDVTAIYKGFFKGGISKCDLSKVKKENKIGSEEEFNVLNQLLTENGGKLYYYINPYKGTEKQVNLKSDVGVSISKNYVKTFIDNAQLMYTDFYYVKSSLVPEYLQNFIETDIYAEESFAIDYVSTLLFSDYTKDQYTSRTQALEKLIPVLEKCSGSAFYNANQYALKYAKDVFDVPTVSSQYLYFTDSVPFLSMVLSGSSNTYSQFLNLGCNSKYTLLKLVEYGICPSFLVTEEVSSALIDTPQEQCFSTCYDDWKEQIQKYYAFVNGALKYTNGQTMQSHMVLQEGIIKVSYDSCDIYINYTCERYEQDGVVIEPLSYTVKEM